MPFRISLLMVALLTAGCPETLQQQCPGGTTSVGAFTLTFNPDDAGDTCRVVKTVDGGPSDASIQSPGPTQATLCTSPADGGVINLVLTGQQTRTSSLDDAGHFLFKTRSDGVANTQCGCVINIAETFGGTLIARAGGPAVFDPDGGLPPVGSIDASLVDDVTSADGGTADCRCNLPCPLRYSVQGTPF
jgi:hypothetical protein